MCIYVPRFMVITGQHRQQACSVTLHQANLPMLLWGERGRACRRLANKVGAEPRIYMQEHKLYYPRLAADVIRADATHLSPCHPKIG